MHKFLRFGEGSFGYRYLSAVLLWIGRIRSVSIVSALMYMRRLYSLSFILSFLSPPTPPFYAGALDRGAGMHTTSLHVTLSLQITSPPPPRSPPFLPLYPPIAGAYFLSGSLQRSFFLPWQRHAPRKLQQIYSLFYSVLRDGSISRVHARASTRKMLPTTHPDINPCVCHLLTSPTRKGKRSLRPNRV